MSLENHLNTRSQGRCELCASQTDLAPYLLPASSGDDNDIHLLLCATCRSEAEAPADVNHWRCLNDSMWSQVPAVQVLAWRQLKRLSAEVWARDLLDMLYLDEATLKWAEAGLGDDDGEPTLDSNGSPLSEGDSVTLIKDLEVKGAGFTAKRGTLVKDIRLTNNPKHIEGKVNGVQIVLVAAYLKKA